MVSKLKSTSCRAQLRPRIWRNVRVRGKRPLPYPFLLAIHRGVLPAGPTVCANAFVRGLGAFSVSLIDQTFCSLTC
jgi:hypothetical protein